MDAFMHARQRSNHRVLTLMPTWAKGLDGVMERDDDVLRFFEFHLQCVDRLVNRRVEGVAHRSSTQSGGGGIGPCS